MTKRQQRILLKVIDDIDDVIAKVHSTRMDFRKGSAVQSLINQLDGARVTTRVIIHQLEETNAVPTHPQIDHTDGGVRDR